MSNINKPNTFSANTTISSSEVNDNFDTIYNDYNGSISATNLASNAVTTAKITDLSVTTAKLNTGAVTSTKLDSTLLSGWAPTTAPSTITYNGNRSYSCVFSGTDLTGTLSPGMRVRTTRTVTAPTQCTSLNGTTQYYNKTSPNKCTFTDDFVVMAWVKLTSYASGYIASRYNGTSGWALYLNATGTVELSGFNAGAGNNSNITSSQSVPLNKWVHVAAQLDMSTFTATTTTSYIMIDGLDVPATVTRSGTNPTALVQAGNLEVGGGNGGTNPFPGKIAQVAFFTAKVTQANVVTYISQGLLGTETSLGSAFSFNNSITDLNTTTPNDLTAQNSAVATATDSPFTQNGFGTATGTTDYGIITSSTFSTDTTLVIQVPEGCTIPTSGGVSAMSYSTQKIPYGFPGQRGKWQVIWRLINGATATLVLTSNTWSSGLASNGLYAITIPIGEWSTTYSTNRYSDQAATAIHELLTTLSTSNNSESDVSWTSTSKGGAGSASTFLAGAQTKTGQISLSAATTYYLVGKNVTNTGTVATHLINTSGTATITAECAHL